MCIPYHTKTLIRPQTRCFKRTAGIQSAHKYLWISTWPQHILIHILLPLAKDKSEQENLQRKTPNLSIEETLCLANIMEAKNHTGKIFDLDRDAQPHPLYSPNLEPSDLHFFHSRQYALNDKKFYGENICGKLLELETSWILFERNQ